MTRRTQHRRGRGFGLSMVVALAMTVGTVWWAPTASAVNACLGQLFNTFSSSGTCTVQDGETVAFVIQAGAGGNGANNGSYVGGNGGLGGRVTGTYTNTSGSQQTLTVDVGAPGNVGIAPATPPTSATDDSISVGGTTIAYVTGGAAATNATVNANGTNGASGGLTYPVSLPSGWTATAAGGAPSIRFASPTPPAPDPVYPPGAPTEVKATAGDAQANVTWVAPMSAGSYPITTYQVTTSPGGRTCLASAPALTCAVSGLTNGSTYTFAVRALNGAGWGASSDPSEPVTLPMPGAKTIVVTGSRAASNPSTIRVEGATTGLVGAQVVPWFKYASQSGYSQGMGTRTIDAAGRFTWTRTSNKRTLVYFVSGSVRSNTVVIAVP